MCFHEVNILYVKFCAIPCNRSRDLTTASILEKTHRYCNLLFDMHQNIISINLCNDAIKYQVSLNFASCVFGYRMATYMQTYQKSWKCVQSSCKTCKTVKNRKSKIFWKAILHLIYLEESKNFCLSISYSTLQKWVCLYSAFVDIINILRKKHIFLISETINIDNSIKCNWQSLFFFHDSKKDIDLWIKRKKKWKLIWISDKRILSNCA